jgi:hypothetical protein
MLDGTSRDSRTQRKNVPGTLSIGALAAGHFRTGRICVGLQLFGDRVKRLHAEDLDEGTL